MSSKKNIDRLFQEKFKDFDVKPDPKVWQNLSSKLNNKEEDKPIVIIPLWLKIGGIAASLSLLLFLGQFVFNTNNKPNTPSIVDTQKTSNTDAKTINIPTVKDKENLELNNDLQTKDKENSSYKTKTTVTSHNKNSKNTNNTATGNYNKTLKNNTVIASQNKSITTTEDNNKLNQKNNQNKTVSNSTTKNQGVAQTQDANSTKNINVNSNNAPNNAITQNKTNINSKTTAVAENEIEDKTEVPKTSIEEAIAANKDINDPIEKEEDVSNRWNVNVNVAPVYYNSFGEGSHIDEQFNKNNKSGEINTSYGVKVGYALNDKLTLRSGINRLNLSYDTDNVIVYQNVSTIANPKDLRNIDFNSDNSQSINIISSNNLLLGINNSSLIKNVALSQRISYYELPVEVEYALVNNKFNLNVIGGVSTFVLEDNKLVSEYDGYKVEIGSANNINNVSFSANFGIGLNYKFSEAVIFNFEPTLKYQLNAFNNTSGNFNPYIIGVYTGFSYKF